MSESQEFCLRWNDFHSSFHMSLEALRGDDSFTDVTLSCGGHLFKAHRVILSACSAHFKDILKEVPPQQHPVIVLPTVERDVMRAVLEFIYRGQVNVRQARLGAFLQVAETFAIQGLADEQTKRNSAKTPERSRSSDAPSHQPSSKRRRAEPQPDPGPMGGAGPPPPPPPPAPQQQRSADRTMGLDLPVKPEPESMLDELEEMLEPQPDQAGLEALSEAHGLMAVTQEDSGGSQANFKRRCRSLVWEYFERITPFDARCLVCGRVFRQGASGNTTNLRVHLHTHDVYLRPLAAGGGLVGGPTGSGVGRASLSAAQSQLIQIQIEDVSQGTLKADGSE
ncbi:broad-complex core protein isoforms 1/2/3/4/5-like isoform X2 [Amphibalanus amphitrite]|uniref:broad-complex core protein isoforms 1/2/3/4/5-like isoform X2 n=1 Tax=Amphibalanus amphitrite TaxID=1232801 RepID=UPI001C90D40F|nr:broad-complex core protein isoforms 1/2/3/4/5-like isoform X2 [Amphibalanus amphitrite]